MTHWTLRQRILASFGAILILMAITAGVAYTRLDAINQNAVSMEEDTTPGLFLAVSIRGAWAENHQVMQRLIFVDGNPDAVKRDIQRLAEVQRVLDQLMHDYESTAKRDADRSLFAGFKAAREQYANAREEVLQDPQSAKTTGSALFDSRLTPLYEGGRQSLKKIVDDDKTYSDLASDNIRHSVGTTQVVLLVAMVVIILVACAAGFFLLRAISQPMRKVVEILDVMRNGNLTQRLKLDRTDEFGALEAGFNRMSEELTALVGQAQKSSIQVTTSVSEIAATARQQQATASETAATTTEIGSTSREIVSTAQDLARTMRDLSGAAEESAQLAGNSRNELTRMSETMRMVMEAAGSVNAKLAILNEKAGNINQVVATITKVADQTNLLSLNAAIEAEKAGEYGRGFAVVATEIRRLADQTAVATYDIEQMVKEIQSAVSAGVMGMDKFSEEVRRGMLEVVQVSGNLEQIINQVQLQAPQFHAINEGMENQAGAAEQITQALLQLSEAAQQTVDSLRQSTQAIEDLTLVANGLRTGVSRFKVQT